MPVVLVHGNPETPAVWDLVVTRLADAGRDAPVRLSPPGFGATVPEDFDPTPQRYRDWLVSELERIPGPVDLVGHDWGGVHVALAVAQRPDLVRSWASDALGILEADYVWHPLAQIWQTAGDGETWVGELLKLSLDERVGQYVQLGMDERVARPVAEAFDSVMGRTILGLYRSAAQPTMALLGKSLRDAARRPGLALVATEDDTVGTEAQRRQAARRAGATVSVLEGLGHWWMTERDGEPGVRALIDFWSALDYER